MWEWIPVLALSILALWVLGSAAGVVFLLWWLWRRWRVLTWVDQYDRTERELDRKVVRLDRARALIRTRRKPTSPFYDPKQFRGRRK